MRRRVLGWVTFGAGVTFLAAAAWFLNDGDPTAPDRFVYDAVQEAYPAGQPRWGDDAWEVTIDNVAIWTLDAALLVALGLSGRGRWAAALGASLVGQWFVVQLLKAWIDRPRPPLSGGSTGAFPSGHVANFALPVFLGFLVVAPLLRVRRGRTPHRRRDVVVVVAAVLAVAALRVAAHAHWLTDTLGAALLALAWAGSTRLGFEAWAGPVPSHESASLNLAPRVRST